MLTLDTEKWRTHCWQGHQGNLFFTIGGGGKKNGSVVIYRNFYFYLYGKLGNWHSVTCPGCAISRMLYLRFPRNFDSFNLQLKAVSIEFPTYPKKERKL